MCTKANYKPANIDFGGHTASHHRNPTPAVLQIKIHIDSLWTVNCLRKEDASRSLLSESTGERPLVSLGIDIFIAYVATANLQGYTLIIYQCRN